MDTATCSSVDTLRDHLAELCERFNEAPPACPVARLLALDEIRRARRELEAAVSANKTAGPA